ncbi:MAG: hypothetical protein WA418_03350 [Bradyrhizobium sp.]
MRPPATTRRVFRVVQLARFVIKLRRGDIRTKRRENPARSRGASMAPQQEKSGQPGWMPAPSTVVAETRLVPPRREAAGRAAVAQAGAAPPATTYRILRTTEVDPYDAPVVRTEIPALGVALARPPGDSFQGTKRKAAKLSIGSAQIESFDDLTTLVASLPADEDMTSHTPPISDDKTSDRVEEEERNVSLHAFLFAASREDDNDFHLIIGRAPSASLLCMTAEVSGLPPADSASFAPLKRSRDAFKDFFKDNLPGSTYDFYDPPIPIEIQGSLFFDITHATGSHPGPSKLRPHIPTIWEIHPITNIVFEPDA